jgi:hypothetical protein
MAPILWALWGSPLQGLRVFFDAAGQAVWALWGSPLQGLRVTFDAAGAGGASKE